MAMLVLRPRHKLLMPPLAGLLFPMSGGKQSDVLFWLLVFLYKMLEEAIRGIRNPIYFVKRIEEKEVFHQ